MAEKIGSNYVYSRKVNPAEISESVIDEAQIRQGLRDTFTATSRNDCRVEVLM